MHKDFSANSYRRHIINYLGDVPSIGIFQGSYFGDVWFHFH